MGKIHATISLGANNQGNSYVNDFGNEVNLTKSIQLPKDIATEDNAREIATLLRGSLIKFNKIELIPTPSNPCSSITGFKTRTLTFIRSNGSNISMPILSRQAILSIGSNIKNKLNELAENYPIVCVKYNGEIHQNLNDFFGLNNRSGEIGTSPSAEPPNGGKGSYYSGSFRYKLDATFGTETVLPFKVRSNVNNGVPTFLGSNGIGCMGRPIGNIPCTDSSNRDHRYFGIDYFIDGGGVEHRDIPVASHSSEDIKSCGNSLAQISGVFCISYQGENARDILSLLSEPEAQE